MSVAVTESTTHVQSAVLESFLAISRVSLAGAERLSELNSAALREAFTDGAAVVRTFAEITLVPDIQDIQSKLVAPMMHKALAYTRSVREVAVQTQQEVSRLMQSQLSVLNRKTAMSDSWQGVLASFSATVKQQEKALGR